MIDSMSRYSQRGTPANVDDTQLVTSDTEAGALEMALNALKAHPAHEGLTIEEGVLNHRMV